MGLLLVGCYLINKTFLLIYIIVSLLLGGFAFAENLDKESNNKIAIFYPEAKEPYHSIYQEIIAGSVKAASEYEQAISYEKFIITKKFDSEQIAQSLKQKHIYKVIVLGLKESPELKQYNLAFIHCDVSNSKNVDQAISQVVETYGGIDCLINMPVYFLMAPLLI